MGEAQDFRKLRVWQKSHRLTLDVYRLTDGFPEPERYGLINQMRRASVSIASNIAEGSARFSDRDFRRFIHIALGSASELEYQLLLAHDLGHLNAEEHAKLSGDGHDVKRMLSGLKRRLSPRWRADGG